MHARSPLTYPHSPRAAVARSSLALLLPPSPPSCEHACSPYLCPHPYTRWHARAFSLIIVCPPRCPHHDMSTREPVCLLVRPPCLYPHPHVSPAHPPSRALARSRTHVRAVHRRVCWTSKEMLAESAVADIATTSVSLPSLPIAAGLIPLTVPGCPTHPPNEISEPEPTAPQITIEVFTTPYTPTTTSPPMPTCSLALAHQ